MAYNFKSIADVDIVAEPAKSANVLIEENGVIKKAPKTAVGGSGNGSETVIIFTESNNLFGVPAPDGLYEKLQDLFNNHIPLNLVSYMLTGDNRYFPLPMNSVYIAEDNVFEGWFDNNKLRVYPNGLMDFFYDN